MSEDIILMKLKKQIEAKDVTDNSLVRGLCLWEEQKKELTNEPKNKEKELFVSIYGKEGSGMSTLALKLSEVL